jgi:hypothetical protein
VLLSPLEQSSLDAASETPEDVQAILGLTTAGWGRRRIAKELGCSPEHVRKYRRQGSWEAYGKPRRIAMAMSIAKFPFVRTLEGFEYEAQPSLDPGQIRELATCRWVRRG